VISTNATSRRNSISTTPAAAADDTKDEGSDPEYRRPSSIASPAIPANASSPM